MSKFCERLHVVRSRAGLSQAKMGAALDVADRTYKNYELGYRSPPLEFLQRLAEKFHVDMAWLIGTCEENSNAFDRFVELFSAFDAAREA